MPIPTRLLTAKRCKNSCSLHSILLPILMEVSDHLSAAASMLPRLFGPPNADRSTEQAALPSIDVRPTGALFVGLIGDPPLNARRRELALAFAQRVQTIAFE